jgi:glycosyltransferase involved in cell wall biosynthesis
MKILFLYLKAFSSVGGIEKYNRVFIKSLCELFQEESSDLEILSLYDKNPDPRYYLRSKLSHCNSSKSKFLVQSLIKAFKSDVIILSHINLSIVGMIVKKFLTNKKVFILTYGIDAWNNQSWINKFALESADKIFTISNYTKSRIVRSFNISEEKISILPCALDPYFIEYEASIKPEDAPNIINKIKDNKIILTVARLNISEKFKGHDNVISALPKVIKVIPNLKYVIVGKGDASELTRIRKLISDLNLDNHVVIAGYIRDDELPYFYLNSDVFVMTSKKEGFGIVYLESLYCGTPVIAGNKDGSFDALQGGRLGFLIDPDDIDEIADTILNVLNKKVDQKLISPAYLKKEVYSNFNYDIFRTNLKNSIYEFSR